MAKQLISEATRVEATYTYDAMGNRLSLDFNESTTDYEYDAANQIDTVDEVSYTYDGNGNLTARGSDTFDWDYEDRMTDAETDSLDSSYVYNGDGLRVTRTIDAVTVDYYWDVAASGQPAVLQDSDGYTYVYGLDLISRVDDQGDEEYYLYDGLGSATGLADDAGDLTDTIEYDVFGAVRSQTGSSSNEFTFTGEQVDPSNLQFLRARYYDPTVGRFLSRDRNPGSISDPRTQNPYTYAVNSPCNYVDPSGAVAVESGFSITTCSARVTARGIGPYLNMFQCLGPYCGAYDLFPDGWDVLFDLQVTVRFATTPSGSTILSAEHTDSTSLGWSETTFYWEPAADGNAVHWAHFYDSSARNYGWGPFRIWLLDNNSASVHINFSVDQQGDGSVVLSPEPDFSGTASDLLSWEGETACRTERLQ